MILIDKIFQRASWLRWWYWASNQPQTLVPFEEFRNQLLYTSPRNRGIQQIPLYKIVGSVGRAGAFDPRFRPLKRTV